MKIIKSSIDFKNRLQVGFILRSVLMLVLALSSLSTFVLVIKLVVKLCFDHVYN